MDPIIYLQLLNASELEVEYLVRGLSSRAVDSKEILINSLRAEQLDRALIQRNTHIKENPELEVEECFNRYEELTKATEEQGNSPPVDFVTLAYVKAKHYKERIGRLINSFGETPKLTKIYRNWRYIFNDYHKMWHEYQDSDIRDISPQGRGAVASSFSEKLDNLISNNSIVDKTSPPFHPKNTAIPKPNYTSKVKHIPVIETRNMKGSVADFFLKVGSQQNNKIQNEKHLVDNTSFIPNYMRDRSQHASNFEYTENSQSATMPTHFRLDNFYKIRQRWNLSFDGTDSLNVHDFVYRLEQMAKDDGFPIEYLTKVLHLFLTKKAEDWYWVYKTDHSGASWYDMKNSLLSYFSSSNYEEEIKEQMIRRYQGQRESFSDFSLCIQKMNARLHSRLSERQLVYRLCQNMYPALKNVTLPFHQQVQNVDELRILCRDYEKLWEQSGYDPRRFGETAMRRRPPMNELNIGMENLNIYSNPDPNVKQQSIRLEESTLAAYTKGPDHNKHFKTTTANNYVCWNCRDIGHKYQDCSKAFLDVFCFGCGAANVRKPACQNCMTSQKGNCQPSANYLRGSRLGTDNKHLESKDPSQI